MLTFEGLPNRVGRPALGPAHQIPHFYRQGLGRPGPPKPSLLSTGLGRPGPPNPSLLSTGPGPQIPHFYRRALGQPGPAKSLTFIDRARPPKPLTSIGQTPHFYQPGQAALPQPGLRRRPPEQPPPIFPGLAPSLFGKPSHDFSRSPDFCESVSDQ